MLRRNKSNSYHHVTGKKKALLSVPDSKYLIFTTTPQRKYESPQLLKWYDILYRIKLTAKIDFYLFLLIYLMHLLDYFKLYVRGLYCISTE